MFMSNFNFLIVICDNFNLKWEGAAGQLYNQRTSVLRVVGSIPALIKVELL